MDYKPNSPRHVENFTSGVRCDNCNADMTTRSNVWIWQEHTGCSRTCIEKAYREARPDPEIQKQEDTELI